MGVGLIWLRLKRACCAANASMTAVFPIGRSWPANCAPGNAGAIATRQLLSGASPWMMPGSSSSVFILQSTIDGLLGEERRFTRARNRLGPTCHAQLAEQIAHMLLDRRQRDHQF